jgi:hypothetical protein
MSTPLAQPPATLPEASEADPLARELASAFRGYVDHFKAQYRCTAGEAVAKAQECSAEYEELVLHRPPEELSWLDLEHLAERNAALMTRRWQEIKAKARDELQSGHWAAQAVEGDHSSPWRRAQFLAIRDDLAREWQPRTGIERQLIDALAQAQTGVFTWQVTLAIYVSHKPRSDKHDIENRGHWNPPRVSVAQAIEQAAQMVDRYQKMFLRTLRALCNLRKVPLAVVVQNAGQVNVGEQQVNLNGK